MMARLNAFCQRWGDFLNEMARCSIRIRPGRTIFAEIAPIRGPVLPMKETEEVVLILPRRGKAPL